MQLFAPLNSEPVPIIQQIEVATFFQLPSFQIIGLPCPEVAEAKERIRAAIEASGLHFPKRKVVLNLSPASIRKRGTGLDLAMALGVLSYELSSKTLIAAWGELGLDGSVKCSGQITRSIYATWKAGISYLMISKGEALQALQAMDCIRRSKAFSNPPPALIPVHSLIHAWKIILDGKLKENTVDMDFQLPLNHAERAPKEENDAHTDPPPLLLPLSPSLERTLCIASAGYHHILLLGPKGVGKSHALEWLIDLLQPVSLPVSLEDELKQRLVNELGSTDADYKRVRRVSSSVRPAALLGTAQQAQIRPGEFSLAHGGILIADELPEWARDSREALREPLERGKVTLTRANGSLELPARFLFAANGNFCPCGGWPYYLSPPVETKIHFPKCHCTPPQRRAYLAKLSGPLLDRIDLISLVTPPPIPSTIVNAKESLSITKPENLRENLRERVQKTRELLIHLWGKPPGLLSGYEIEFILRKNQSLQNESLQLPQLSLRSRHKTARLSLSFAAWDGVHEPSLSHWTEAAHFRPERYFDEITDF